ncbi:hypothetical protein SALBM311S_04321 [Streptomyces alboniger]
MARPGREGIRRPGRGTPPIGVPDGFGYQITVDGKTVYAANPRLTDEQRKLISPIIRKARNSLFAPTVASLPPVPS